MEGPENTEAAYKAENGAELAGTAPGGGNPAGAGKTAGTGKIGRPVSPVNGQPIPVGVKFQAGDSRAKEMQKRATRKRKENADLRKLCRMWMDEKVATGAGGEKITGGQMMVRVAVKEMVAGNPKFWELLRDTAGFKPVDRVMVAEVEPAVIAQVERMVKEAANDGAV